MELVQYILVRKDLLWPTGAIIAQACHASTACLHMFRDDESVISYLENYTTMKKVVLEVANLYQFQEISTVNFDKVVWTEQPENIPTAIAFKPYKKDVIHPFVKHLKLFK